MDPNMFSDIYGILPQDKKRIKRERENDLFETFENNSISEEDIKMFDFTSIDSSIFSEEYSKIESSLINQELLHSPSLDSHYFENVDQINNNNDDVNSTYYLEIQQNLSSCKVFIYSILVI